jgi:hypothetical protein
MADYEVSLNLKLKYSDSEGNPLPTPRVLQDLFYRATDLLLSEGHLTNGDHHTISNWSLSTDLEDPESSEECEEGSERLESPVVAIPCERVTRMVSTSAWPFLGEARTLEEAAELAENQGYEVLVTDSGDYDIRYGFVPEQGESGWAVSVVDC